MVPVFSVLVCKFIYNMYLPAYPKQYLVFWKSGFSDEFIIYLPNIICAMGH